MNRGPILFLGVFVALAASWYGLVFLPQVQLGPTAQGTNVVDTTQLYPAARAGLAEEGLQVYRSLGCVTCHSQQVRQEGVRFDVTLTHAGTNPAPVVQAIRKARPDLPEPEIERRISKPPVAVLTGEPDSARVDSLVRTLDAAGAKSSVRLIALGPDIARGWGRGRSVARDYLRDRPALPGSQRMGPDLATVGLRLPSRDWHYLHLYDPKSVVAKSVMPPYRFLFAKRKVGARPSPEALRLQKESAAAILAGSRTNFSNPNAPADVGPTVVDALEVVPTDAGRALVAYLVSLRAEVPLFERPLASGEGAPAPQFPTPVATNAPVLAPGP